MEKLVLSFLILLIPAAFRILAVNLHEETVQYFQDGNALEGYLNAGENIKERCQVGRNGIKGQSKLDIVDKTHIIITF